MITIARRKRAVVGPKLRGSRPWRARRAFTLLEVLVALAVFATASIVLASAYINILNGYQVAAQANESDADTAFARSLVLTMADRKKLEEGGEFDTAEGAHVRWSVDIASTNTADVFAVTLTCEVGAVAGKPPYKSVETFTVLRPTWSLDSGEHDKLKQDAKARIMEMQGKEAKP